MFAVIIFIMHTNGPTQMTDTRSEQLLSLVELSPDMLFVLDADGRFTFVNDTASQLLGYSTDAMLGKTLWELSTPQDVPVARTLPELSANEVWDREIDVTALDGSIKHVRIRCIPVVSRSGVVEGFHGALRDRTSQRALEEKLRQYRESLEESERRLRILVHEAPDVIFCLDTDGRFTLLNPQIETFLGYAPEECIGRHIWDFIVPDQVVIGKTIVHLMPHAVWDEELGIIDKDGDQKWARIRGRWITDSAGECIELLGIMRDRTARKILEEELKTSREALAGKIQIIDDLYAHLVQSGQSKAIARHTAEVAHELRQPLAIIGGFAKRITKQLEDPNNLDVDGQRQSAVIIAREVQRLETILKGLIDFTRQEAVSLEHTDPNDIIREVLEINSERIKYRNIEVETELRDEVGEIPLDPQRFQQVVRNLVANAIEATPPGGFIRIESGFVVPSDKACETGELECETYFEMKIANYGKIIPPEDIRRIFDPFYTTKKHGTGVGLPLSKKIVEEHKGSISVKSDETATVFSVWLPLSPEGFAEVQP